jgi:hypothetical protein
LSKPGLPDGIFAYQKSPFGNILEGLEIEIVGICTYLQPFVFKAIWYILWPI